MAEAKFCVVGAYLKLYDYERPRQSIEYRTPHHVFEEGWDQVHQSELSVTPE